jgi:hypothetical protein
VLSLQILVLATLYFLRRIAASALSVIHCQTVALSSNASPGACRGTDTVADLLSKGFKIRFN